MTTTAVPAAYIEEPLNFPLTFQYTEKAKGKANASLLSEGEYRAVALRQYQERQLCKGCDTKEKAKELVVEERTTLEKHEVGLECMRDMYGVDARSLREHKNDVVRTRSELKNKLGLTGSLSTSRVLEITREAVQTYVPAPERLVAELKEMDDFTLGGAQTDRMRDIYFLARYHGEWKEEPRLAHARWLALSTHPAFRYTSQAGAVAERCAAALARGRQLPEEDVYALNADLRRAAGWIDRRHMLVRPEEHATAQLYKAALEQALLEHLGGQDFDARPWAAPHADPTGLDPMHIVSPRGRLFGLLAVRPQDVERVKRLVNKPRSYWKDGLRPMVRATDRTETYQRSAVIRPRRNEDNETEDVVVAPAASFPYRRVAWALVEEHVETYRLWRLHTRELLGRYP